MCDQGTASISLHFPWFIFIFLHGSELAAPSKWDSVSRFRVPMGGIGDIANHTHIQKKNTTLSEKEMFSGEWEGRREEGRT